MNRLIILVLAAAVLTASSSASIAAKFGLDQVRRNALEQDLIGLNHQRHG